MLQESHAFGVRVSQANGRFLVEPGGRILGMDSVAAEILQCRDHAEGVAQTGCGRRATSGVWYEAILSRSDVLCDGGRQRIATWHDHDHRFGPFICHVVLDGVRYCIETRQLSPIVRGQSEPVLCGSVERQPEVPTSFAAARPIVYTERANTCDPMRLTVVVDIPTGGLREVGPPSELRPSELVPSKLVGTEMDGGNAVRGTIGEPVCGGTPLDLWRRAATLGEATDGMVEPGRSEFESCWRELQAGRNPEFYCACLMHRERGQDQLVHIHTFVTHTDSLGYPAQALVSLRLDGSDAILADDEIAEGISLIRHVRESIGATDLEGKIRYWSEGAQALYGWRASEVIGRDVSEVLLGRSECETENEHLRYAMVHGSWAGRTVHQRKDGSRFVVEAYVSLIRSAAGKPIGFVGLGRDATERIEAERRAGELQTRLQRVSWTGVKVEMLAGISHELNQPLYSIQNYTSAAKNLLAQGQAGVVEELVATILGQVTKANTISEQMRYYARHRELQFKTLSLRRITEACVECMEQLTRMVGARVVWNVGDGELLVRGDALPLQQAISNLIRNACEAMGEVENADGHRLEITLGSDEEGAFLRIGDTGPGIAKCDRSRIFDLFYTTKQEGTGMGLALSRSVVTQQGGQLSLLDTSPRGAAFEIRLPRDVSQCE